MKYFKTLVLCGSMVLAAASLAPVLADDPGGCPDWNVNCGGGKTCTCAGTQDGDRCLYDRSCQNGGCCKSDDLLFE
jgi:hypothetical protein